MSILMPDHFEDAAIAACGAWYDSVTKPSDPNVIATLTTDNHELRNDVVRAALALGRLKEDEAHHWREEPIGGVSLVRGAA